MVTQITLAEHLAKCEAAMQRMSVKNPHRLVIDHSAQLIVALVEQLGEARQQLAAQETESKKIVLTDAALTPRALGVAEPSPIRVGSDAESH